MEAYYYVVSSLPRLTLGEPPPLTYGEFLDSCAPWLTPWDDTQLKLARTGIENIDVERVTEDALLRWIAFENTLRREWVQFRAKYLGIQEDPFQRPDLGLDANAISLFHQAVQAPTPYRVELNLLQMRWDFLTQLESGHHFDGTALILYGLKLQLLERMATFSERKGQQVLDLICEQNLHGQ